MPYEIKHGTHVAYLHETDDTKLKNPLARIALRPFESDETKHRVIYPESKTYGTGNTAFSHTVRKWAETHFPLKDGEVYTKHRNVLDDSGGDFGSVLIKNSPAGMEKAFNHKSAHIRAAYTRIAPKEHLEKLLKDPMSYVRCIS